MQLLVVNDFLPDKATDEGRRLKQILQALRELGHAVTFIARDGRNQPSLEPGLNALEIRVYSGDAERLPALGKDVTNSCWSLDVALAEKQFDVAILIQNFRCGISIPEHYLDAIRGIPGKHLSLFSTRHFTENPPPEGQKSRNNWHTVKWPKIGQRAKKRHSAAQT
jgi:hypothetical protein